jgi:hypothetical protein
VGYATVGIEVHGIPPFAKSAKDGAPADLLHVWPRIRNARFIPCGSATPVYALKESRMEFDNATNLDGKSGGSPTIAFAVA